MVDKFYDCYSADFNPRSHEGSDLQRSKIHFANLPFQSTLPRGERRFTVPGTGKSTGDFNPRSHEGSDGNKHNNCVNNLISIHAPTRGATLPRLRLNGLLGYFNPRSHEGSDNVVPFAVFPPTNFNPRSHEGSDICTGGHFLDIT